MEEVKAMTGLEKDEIYEKMRVGEFPKSIKISYKETSWSEMEVKHWRKRREL
jgi:predicted DNA-binding transcriptional regulator AlpA